MIHSIEPELIANAEDLTQSPLKLASFSLENLEAKLQYTKWGDLSLSSGCGMMLPPEPLQLMLVRQLMQEVELSSSYLFDVQLVRLSRGLKGDVKLTIQTVVDEKPYIVSYKLPTFAESAV